MIRKILSLYVAAFMMLPGLALSEETEETFPDYTVLPVEAGDIVPVVARCRSEDSYREKV